MELQKKKQYILLILGLIFFSLTTTNFVYYFRINSNRYDADYWDGIKIKSSSGSWHTSITRAVGTNPYWLDAGDANNDGYTDIVVSHCNDDKISILTWNSVTQDWNSFLQRSTGGCPGNPVIKDVNNDGYNDIIVPNYYDDEVSMYFWNPAINNWNSEVKKYAGYNPYTIAVGDANNDGYNDIAITHYALYSYISVYLWNPAANDWHYSEILNTEWNPAYVFIEDVNNDGYKDIVATHNDGSTGGLSILLWNPTSNYWNDYFFKEAGKWPSKIAIADANNDGYKDIVCTNSGLYTADNKLAILLWNPSTKTWNPIIIKTVGYRPSGVFIGDANTDGKNDIVCTNYDDDTISILLWNSGINKWDPQLILPVGNGPRTPNIKDLNHDGKNDITLTNNNDNDVSLLYWFEDNTPPSLIINNPIQDGNYSVAPIFNVDITDNNYIYKKWYTINMNPQRYFFTENGPISDWLSLPDGTVTITFYANDTSGNEISDSVTVNKDATEPTVNVISPINQELFGEDAPSYVVEVFDEHLDLMWYTYPYNDPTRYFFTDNDTLLGWAGLPDGYITIRFYANDTYNNEIYEEIGITKDTTSPEMYIYYPNPYDIFSNNAPFYNIGINEYNLDTFWYTLNESSNVYTSNLYGYINQTLWDTFPSSFIKITFYANDSFNRISSQDINIIKDIDDPIVDVIFPLPNELVGKKAPMFEVSVTEPNIDEILYSLDNGITNYTLSTCCNQYAWDNCEDGYVTIDFYARDMAGNRGFYEIIIRKDTISPNIIINSPIGGQEFSKTPPNFTLSISKPNIDSIWFTFDNGEHNFSCGVSGQIDANLWDNLENGIYNVKFYANDTVGNLGYSTVQISKNVKNETPSVHGFNFYVMGFSLLVGIIYILVDFKRRKKIC